MIIAIFLHNSWLQIEEDKISDVIAQSVSKTEGKNYSIQDIKISKNVNLNFKRIIVYSFSSADGGEIVGISTFYKGLNKKYAVDQIYNQKKYLYFFVVRDIVKQYLIIAGKNYQGTINSIEVTKKDGSKYQEDISPERYFIFRIDVNLLKSFRILDKEGNEIPVEQFDKYERI